MSFFARQPRSAAVLAVALLFPALRPSLAAQQIKAGAPSVAEAIAFVDSAEAVLMDLAVRAERAAWIQSTYITEDTELLAAQEFEKYVAASVALAKQAARYVDLDLPEDVRRKLTLLRLSQTMPAPADPAKTAELTRIAARMESTYGRGRYCRPSGECFDLEELSDTLALSRDPDRLLEAW
ncbi:MAG: M2 family metallopeptidase, partial [bacterium]